MAAEAIVKFKTPGLAEAERKIENLDNAIDGVTQSTQQMNKEQERSARAFDRVRSAGTSTGKSVNALAKVFNHLWKFIRNIIVIFGTLIVALTIGAQGIKALSKVILFLISPIQHLELILKGLKAGMTGITAVIKGVGETFSYLGGILKVLPKNLKRSEKGFTLLRIRSVLLRDNIEQLGNRVLKVTEKLNKFRNRLVQAYTGAKLTGDSVVRMDRFIKGAGATFEKVAPKIKEVGDKLQKNTVRVTNFTSKLLASKTAILLYAVAIGAVIAALVIAIPLFIKLTKVAAVQEVIMNRLRNQILTTGISYESVSGSVEGFLRSMIKTTTYSRNVVASVLGHVTQMTGNLKRGFIGTKLAADLAASGFTDFEAAGRYLARAMQGDVTMLARYIPELRKSYGLIKDNMTVSEKWAVTLGVLRRQFGGMAVGETKTLTGMWKQLRNQVTQLMAFMGAPMLEPLKKIVRVLSHMVTKIDEAVRAYRAFNTVFGTEGFPVLGELVYWYELLERKADALGHTIGRITKGVINMMFAINEGLGRAAVDRLKAFIDEYKGGWGEGPIPEPTAHPAADVTRQIEELKLRLLALAAPGEAIRGWIQLYKNDLKEITEGTKAWFETKVKLTEKEQELAEFQNSQFEARLGRENRLAEFRKNEWDMHVKIWQLQNDILTITDPEAAQVQLIARLEAEKSILDHQIQTLEVVIRILEIEKQIAEIKANQQKQQEDVNDEQSKMLDYQRLGVRTANMFSSGLARTVGKANELKNTFAQYAVRLKEAVAQMIIMKTLASVIGGPFGGFLPWSQGGKVSHLAKGGKVSQLVYAQGGFKPIGTDTVPAMLTPGEKVLTARTVRENQTAIAAIEKGRGEAPTIIHKHIHFPSGLVIGDERVIDEVIQKSNERTREA